MRNHNVPGGTAALSTLHDSSTLRTAATQVTNASKAEPRITITPAMWQELRGKLKAVGNPGAARIMHAVEAYERKNGQEPTDLHGEIIKYVVKIKAKSVKTSHWDRILAALDLMHARQKQTLQESITISAAMHQELLTKLRAKGGIGSGSIMNAINNYEVANYLPGTGLKEDKVISLIRAPEITLPEKQWRRINEALSIIPNRSVHVVLSATQRQELETLYQGKGRPAAGRILQAAHAYAEKHGLDAWDLTTGIITGVIKDKQEKIRAGFLEIMLGGLTTMNDCVAVTTTQRQELLTRIKAVKKAMYPDDIKDATDHDIVIRAVRAYEKARELHPVGLTRTLVADVISGSRPAIEEIQWSRIGQALANYDSCKLQQAAKNVTNRKLRIEKELTRIILDVAQRARPMAPARQMTAANNPSSPRA